MPKTPLFVVFIALFWDWNLPFPKNILALLPFSGNTRCSALPWKCKNQGCHIKHWIFVIHFVRHTENHWIQIGQMIEKMYIYTLHQKNHNFLQDAYLLGNSVSPCGHSMSVSVTEGLGGKSDRVKLRFFWGRVYNLIKPCWRGGLKSNVTYCSMSIISCRSFC